MKCIFILILIIFICYDCFVNAEQNLIQIVQHNTKPHHLSVLINGQKYDYDKFGAHISDYHAVDQSDILAMPKYSNSLGFLEAKNEPTLVFEQMQLNNCWLAPAVDHQPHGPLFTIKSVDFVIEFVMNVAGVDTFLWPSTLHSIDELRKEYKQYNNSKTHQPQPQQQKCQQQQKPQGTTPITVGGIDGNNDNEDHQQQTTTDNNFVYTESTRKVSRCRPALFSSCL